MMDIVERMRGFAEDHEPEGWPAVKMKQITQLCDEIDRLRKIEAAAKNLLAVKGRHHTEQAYKALWDAVKAAEE